MGPLTLTGLVCFGAAVGLGMMTSQTRPAPAPADAPLIRGLFIVAAAFIESLGVLGVVVGLLAVELGKATGPASAALVAVLAVIGALVGIGLMVRSADLVDRQAAFIGASFTAGLGMLGPIAGILAIVIDERATPLPPDWPFIAIGLVGGGCALAIGWVGAGAVAAASVAGADLRVIQAALLRRDAPILVVGSGAIGLAVLILLLG